MPLNKGKDCIAPTGATQALALQPLLAIYHPWIWIGDNNFLLFPATELMKRNPPAMDDFLAMSHKTIIQLDISLESPEFPFEGQANQ